MMIAHLALTICVALVPSAIAYSKQHRGMRSIVVLNVALVAAIVLANIPLQIGFVAFLCLLAMACMDT